MKKIIAFMLVVAVLLAAGTAFAAENNEDQQTPDTNIKIEAEEMKEVTALSEEKQGNSAATEEIVKLIRADKKDQAKELYDNTVNESKEGTPSFSIKDHARMTNALMDMEKEKNDSPVQANASQNGPGFYILKDGNVPAATTFFFGNERLPKVIYPEATIYCEEEVTNKKVDFELIINNDGITEIYTAEQGFRPERPYRFAGTGLNHDTGCPILYLNTEGSHAFYIIDENGKINFRNQLRFECGLIIEKGTIFFRLSDDKHKVEKEGGFEVKVRNKDSRLYTSCIIISDGGAFFANNKYIVDYSTLPGGSDPLHNIINLINMDYTKREEPTIPVRPGTRIEVEPGTKIELEGFSGEGFYAVKAQDSKYYATGPLKVGDIIDPYPNITYVLSNGELGPFMLSNSHMLYIKQFENFHSATRMRVKEITISETHGVPVLNLEEVTDE